MLRVAWRPVGIALALGTGCSSDNDAKPCPFPRNQTWHFTRCPDERPLRYEFQTAANPYWTSHHRRFARIFSGLAGEVAAAVRVIPRVYSMGSEKTSPSFPSSSE